MVFKYINMPKLVAFYLREFSVRSDGEASWLYKFLFCLCLPFVSKPFRTARLNALAIAECTNSREQIIKVMQKLTGAVIAVTVTPDEYMAPYDGTDETADFPFDNSDNEDNPIVPFGAAGNAVTLTVSNVAVPRETIQAYLDLLIPFYVKATVIYA